MVESDLIWHLMAFEIEIHPIDHSKNTTMCIIPRIPHLLFPALLACVLQAAAHPIARE